MFSLLFKKGEVGTLTVLLEPCIQQTFIEHLCSVRHYIRYRKWKVSKTDLTLKKLNVFRPLHCNSMKYDVYVESSGFISPREDTNK